MIRLIVGCGYLGRRVAEAWRDAGDEVYAVTRSATRAAEFTRAGLRPIMADVMRLSTLVALRTADTVLYAVGYDKHQSFSIEEVYLQGLMNVLHALPSNTGRIIYISSTGVYGHSHGEWVDERTPCYPDRPGGRACLAAENALAAHARGANSLVLRMAGIYGPDRIPRRSALTSGKAIPAANRGWLNLIHVDDAVRAVLAAEQPSSGSRYYLVSDGHPVPRREYYRELARLLSAGEPTFVEPESASGGRSSGDKRVNNARMLRELKVRLAYPSYREGLAAILAKR